MSTFVLIHGSWGGSWCWRDVRTQLIAAGHQVYTPTLTGLADRRHLGTQHVGLFTHIKDVTGLLEFEELYDATLVGHSYGGMVITGAASTHAKHLKQLVYLDAFLPRPGQSTLMQLPVLADILPTPHQDTPWEIPVPDFATLGIDNPQLRAHTTRLSTPMPLRTHHDALTYEPASLPVTYVEAGTSLFAHVADDARSAGHAVHSWNNTGHMLPLTEPDRITQLLLTEV